MLFSDLRHRLRPNPGRETQSYVPQSPSSSAAMQRRDWAGLPADLVQRIGASLLAVDVTEFVRLRAVCRPWRSAVSNPKSLGGSFNPRKWVMLSGPDSPPSAPFFFLNGYTLVYVVEGLCLLANNATRTYSLLNPFTSSSLICPSGCC